MDVGDSLNQPPNGLTFHLATLERMLEADFAEYARTLLELLRTVTYHGVDDPLFCDLRHIFDRYFTENMNNIIMDNVEHDIIRPEVEVIQEAEASDDPQPEASRRRQREEEEDEGEDAPSRRFLWWDEFDDTDSDDSDEDDDAPVHHQDSEADPGDLPAASRKRSREDDEDVHSQDSKHCRLWKKRERDEDEDGDEGSPKRFRLK
ncbi:acidic leucine-rich nuclear phosphoprotein 32 family member B-like [Acanthochromis polyacanthus]|uniref:acidic leucine-rich nuclear phosphoprotein 32 family member B-like n=1 Tax=Acanthochromis polyacanthus TaxID=80966 RepID=UPI002234C0D5|nr:acidic leucine-rich nuclear phosphoprotein 32 family member B-like [Acanthochromis polyacanthus]XP_051806138.1 acidic leucine-rich nuclear phosphoprotein 32 family member B-like [Acanthochromis polyacanthus]XP_051806139.1 acidic leucine-rich nuclear phosphoprotein 32 family member B-like [Acanthochromis polyacanthus]XP_051806140.1 acidic leucine-rich nuclear phosphoprotein 32 family member B-like [Acanthochromis polyacanthus]XP_051806141.1 acidic leucine-rich nuclear phosphoprotein 32 family